MTIENACAIEFELGNRVDLSKGLKYVIMF